MWSFGAGCQEGPWRTRQPRPETDAFFEDMTRGTQFQESLLDERRSSLSKYRDVVLGAGAGWGRLVYFELATLVAGNLSGALGLALRRLLYRPLLGGLGGRVALGRGLVLRHPGRVRIGDRVLIDEQCVLDAKGADEGIDVGDGTLLSRETILVCKGGPIRIGKRVNFGVRVTVSSVGGVDIGDGTLFAGGCYVGGGRYHLSDRDQSIASQGSYSEGPVVLGPDSWIGAHAVILDGVRLGRGVVVGAGAVVTRDVPDFAVVTGVPAREVKER